MALVYVEAEIKKQLQRLRSFLEDRDGEEAILGGENESRSIPSDRADAIHAISSDAQRCGDDRRHLRRPNVKAGARFQEIWHSAGVASSSRKARRPRSVSSLSGSFFADARDVPATSRLRAALPPRRRGEAVFCHRGRKRWLASDRLQEFREGGGVIALADFWSAGLAAGLIAAFGQLISSRRNCFLPRWPSRFCRSLVPAPGRSEPVVASRWG